MFLSSNVSASTGNGCPGNRVATTNGSSRKLDNQGYKSYIIVYSSVMSAANVRVAVRIRPLLPKEVLHNHQMCTRLGSDSGQVMVGPDRVFSFDYAYGPTASQDEVYQSSVHPLVQSLIDGYNATVFCYGQTGSGKTYTLGGGKLRKFHSARVAGVIV